MQASSAARQEWREHWPLVMASMMGLSFTAIASTTIGLFMDPLEREFGWSRTQISAGLTVYALIAVPLSPFVGAIVDKWGARRLAIPGLLLTASLFASFSLASGSSVQWFALWTAYAVAALAIRNTVWTAAVSSVFTGGRGLALGVTLSGTALTGTIAPVIAQQLIDNFGWREAFLWMGLGWGAVVAVLLFLFLYDARDKRRLERSRTTAADSVVELPGLSFAQALRNRPLIQIALAAALFVSVVTGIGIHLPPILTERGISRETAAVLTGLTGLTAFAGRLLTGWALDRWSSGWLNFANLASPALASAVLIAAPNELSWATLAVVIFGYATGAFMQVCAYLTSRYAGIRNFGKIYGILASIVALGLGISPLIAGMIFDSFGSYTPLLIATIPATLAAGILVSRLGEYPNWDPAES
jgi:MFS family permease